MYIAVSMWGAGPDRCVCLLFMDSGELCAGCVCCSSASDDEECTTSCLLRGDTVQWDI